MNGSHFLPFSALSLSVLTNKKFKSGQSKTVSVEELSHMVRTPFWVSNPLCLSSSTALHFSDYSFWSTTLFTGMSGISLHMQLPYGEDFFKLVNLFFSELHQLLTRRTFQIR
jgi:hypothetical protein